MFAALITSITDLLADATTGLPSEVGADWYVEAAKIGTVPVDWRGGPQTALPAVEVALDTFQAAVDTFEGSQVFDPSAKTTSSKASLRIDVSIVALSWTPMASTAISAQVVRLMLANQSSLLGAEDSYVVHSLEALSGSQHRLDGDSSSAVSTRTLCRFLGELIFSRDASAIEEINVRRIPWDSWVAHGDD